VNAAHGADDCGPSSGDGLDGELWARLHTVVTSANRGDTDSHALELLRWRDEVPLASQQYAGIYLLYLLYRAVKDTLGRSPNQSDLHELTTSAYPRFREIMRAEEGQLEDTFRRAFDLPPLRPPLTAGEFVVFSSVALGVLLVNPDNDLEVMRPGLASWLQRNHARIRAEGLLDDRSR
jgi:hypothetical protein